MKKILVWGLLAVLGIACYDDLGNYDYNDINDMVLEMPRSVSVTIPKKDSVLVEVKAAVTQLDRKDNANLTYLWKKNLSGRNVVRIRFAGYGFIRKIADRLHYGWL